MQMGVPSAVATLRSRLALPSPRSPTSASVAAKKGMVQTCVPVPFAQQFVDLASGECFSGERANGDGVHIDVVTVIGVELNIGRFVFSVG